MKCALIVDDREDNRCYLEVLLQGNNWRTVLAHHGVEALDKARLSPPDIIISDLLMPVMDGYTLLRNWKADPRLKQIPFVVYTATYTKEQDEQLALKMGADAFIIKPEDPDIFIKRIEQVLSSVGGLHQERPAEPVENETEILKVYSQALIRKLEEKMFQLEETNRALEEDIARRRHAEQERQELVHDLGERIKELRTLHHAARLLHNDSLSVREILDRIVTLLPEAMQFPEITAARVSFGREVSTTANYQPQPCRLLTAFTTGNGTRGEVEVVYLEDRPPEDEGPFMKEERLLLESLSEMLRSHLERRYAHDIVLRVARSVSIPIGESFLLELTRLMVETLSATGGVIGILNPKKAGEVYTQTFILRGETVTNVCYNVKGTPCERLIRGEDQIVESGVQQLFPDDHMLVEFGLESYAGTPMLNSRSEVIGLVSVFSSEPMWRSTFMLSALRIFAARAAAEIERQNVTTAMLNSQRQLKQILHSVGEGIHGLDVEGNITFENPAGEIILGWREDEIIGKHSHSLIHHHRSDGSEYPVDECPIYRTLRDGKVRDVENEVFFRKDGTPVPVEYTCAPVRDENGNVTGAVVSFRDTTERKLARQALSASEERFREMADNMGEVFYNFDPKKLRLLYASPAAETILGRPLEELFANPLGYLEAVHEEDRAEAEAAFKRQLEGQETHVDFRVIQPDGTVRWVLEHAVPVFGERGELERIVGTMRDVTEQKTADLRLRESEARFRLLSKATNDAIWDWDMTTNELWWNEGFETLFGHNRDEVERKIDSWYIFIHPDDKDSVLHGIQQAIESGSASWSDEYRFRRKDGGYAYVLDRGYVIRDAAGNPVRMIGGMTDLTERRLTEIKLREQAALLDKAQDAILVRDLDHRITYWNKSAERLYGWTATEAVGKSVQDLLYRDPSHFLAATESTLRDGEWTGDIEQYSRGGRRIVIEGRWTLLRDEQGNPKSIFAVNTDITHSRQLAEQLRQAQKMEAVGQLAGGVAHDFNNILSTVIMQVELLGFSENIDDEVRDGLNHIREAAERAANLTRQLLLFSRRQVMQKRNLDINEVVTGMAKMLQRMIGEDVHLQLHLNSAPLMVRADAGMMEQVLMNLAINARDAMPHGGRLLIETRKCNAAETQNPEATPGAFVCLMVSDSGAGIDPDVLPHIFEPFFTTKEPGKGTGLGLATVFGIVKQHQGWINVESRANQGTRFQIYLPEAAALPADDQSVKAPVSLPSGSETVLLVEDDESVRHLTRITLERNGYSIIEAASGADALMIWPQYRDQVSLLLTDLVMPSGVSGHQLARQLQAENPKLKVIFTTGYSSEIAGRELELRNGENFIQKPCTAEQLLHTIRKCLDSE